ncbi:TonB-dependent receptor [Agaribacter marinus]|uniref:TonB-dependent receptor n=1 Tax=Agaribacter marinus TaxID=1431249 RepID=A0AA37T0U6_9ALTE|nr:TonB-dependent receptor [Agaribacter marinus]GLR71685.1 TonB-dependent receptor [Agaribacter marinus]
MTWLSFCLRLTLCTLGLLVCASNSAWSSLQNAAHTKYLEKHEVDIPGGSLNEALSTLSATFDVSIVADTDFIRQFSILHVRGVYSLDQVLSLMLSPHPINIARTEGGIVLKPIAAQLNAPESSEVFVTDSDIETLQVRGFRTRSSFIIGKQSWNQQVEEEFYRRLQYNGSISSANYGALSVLPSSNLAEAFGYLSGVTISRDFGEGLSVSARGVGPAYQSTMLNGHLLAVNENVRDSGQLGRAFRFDVLPVQHIERIDVYKSPNAAMPESGIGATIGMKSMQALSIGEGIRQISIGLEHNVHAQKKALNTQVLSNWVNQEQSLGLLLTANSHGRFIRQDHFQTWDWEQNGNSYLLEQLGTDVLLPSNRMAITLENERRNTNGASASVQWRPADNIDISAEHFYSSLTSDYIEQRWLSRLDTATQLGDDFAIHGNSLVSADFENVAHRTALDTSKQAHTNSTSMLTLTTQSEPWQWYGSFANTEAISSTVRPITRTRIQTAPINVRFSLAGGQSAQPVYSLDPLPSIALDSSFFEHISARNIRVSDRGKSLRSFLSYQGDDANLRQLKFGVDWRQKVRTYMRQDVNVDVDQLADIPVVQPHVDDVRVSGFLNGYLAGSFPYVWQVPNQSVSEHALQQMPFDLPSQADRARSYKIKERVTGAFTAVDFSFTAPTPMDVNLGLRWQSWQVSVLGAALFELQESSILPLVDEVTTQHAFWLPNLNLSADVYEGVQVKFAMGQSLAFPSYSDLQPGLSLNTTEGVLLASGGNPRLMPVKSSHAEIGVLLTSTPWFKLSVGGFLRRLTGFVNIGSRPIDIDGREYQVSRPENNKGFTLHGLEADAFVNLNKTMSVRLSSTWLADDLRKYGVSAVADWEYKLQLLYEHQKVTASVSMDEQSDMLFNQRGLSTPDTRLASQRFINAHIAYQINDNLELSLTGKNLFASPVIYYFEHAGEEVFKEAEYVGKRLSFNVKWTI